MTPNKPDPTNGEEKIREEFHQKFDSVWTADLMGQDIEAELWEFISASHIDLLEQMIVENEGRKIECINHGTDPQNGQPLECYGYDEYLNSVLDQINTDLRTKIDELKKTNISN